jgi:hypothetical protein
MSEPLLSVGSKGEGVATAKRLLNFHFSPLPPLTNLYEFDSATRTRVIDFQKLSRLNPDGFIGPLTTRRLLDFAKMDVHGVVAPEAPQFLYRRSFVPKLELDVPKFGLPPSQPGSFPKLGQTPSTAPYLTPDWFYNRLPSQNLTLDNVQLSLGNETDIPKGSDSAPIQFSAEFIYLRKRDDNPQWSHGIQFSHTPRSDDGRWSGQVYGKVGLSDWPLAKFGRVSLTNPFLRPMSRKRPRAPGSWARKSETKPTSRSLKRKADTICPWSSTWFPSRSIS